MMRQSTSALVLLAVQVSTACSCADESTADGGASGSASDGAGAGGGTTGGTGDGNTGASGGGGGEAGPCIPTTFVPPQVPAGWERYQDFSCNMPFWVPATAAALPAPIVSEKCNQYAQPGIDCRTMALDWPHELSPGTAGVQVQAEPGKPVRILFARNTIGKAFDTWITLVLADADGPVHMAIGQTWQLTEGLRIVPQGLHQDHFAISTRGGVKDGARRRLGDAGCARCG